MSAFPTRLTRAALGPKLEDAYPVVNPKQQIPASTHNANFAAVAGMSQVVHRALLISSWVSSAFVTAQQAEAWNPDGAQPHPTLTRVAQGNYTYLFASSYLDENGVAQATALLAAHLTDQKVLTVFSDRLEARAWIDAGNPLLVQMRIWDTGGTLQDAPFLLKVF